MTTALKETENGLAVYRQVFVIAKTRKFTTHDTYRTALMAIMCVMTESNMQVLANPNVPESMKIPHDGIGSDHASVGMFQQQIPMWGTAAECMNIVTSTNKFVSSALQKGLTRYDCGVTPWQAVQDIQVSAFTDGSNYHAHYLAANGFVETYWWKMTLDKTLALSFS